MVLTDFEVIAVSADGKRLTVKADGSYGVLVRRDKAFVGKIAGKSVSILVVATKNARGG
jgi:hypothetical protein